MRLAKVLRRMRGSVASRLGLPQAFVTISIAGRSVRIRYGTYPETPDYDYAWQVALARNCHVLLDIGANTGQTALNCLLASEVREAVLVEANPRALLAASENLILNNLSGRVRFVLGFVSDKAGQCVNFHVIGRGAAGSVFRSHSTSAAKVHSSISVSTVTVDDIVEQLEILPDLMVIDVEGSESLVLRGAVQTVRSCSPRILVEVHSPEELGGIRANSKDILGWCNELGYRAWYMAEASELVDPNQIAHRGRCHLLLQDAGEEYPVWLRGIAEGAPMDQWVGA